MHRIYAPSQATPRNRTVVTPTQSESNMTQDSVSNSAIERLSGATSRRQFLRYIYMGGAVVSAGPLLSACGGGSGSSPTSENDPVTPGGTTDPVQPTAGGLELDIPIGPLAAIPALMDSGIDNMQIPEGFSVRRVARTGFNPLTDMANPGGFEWHDAPDGGAVYVNEMDGTYVYVSNSEVAGTGGVGALKFASDGMIIDAYTILENTNRNCAGGKTPWQTWLSCEENGATGQIYECEPFGTAADAVVKPALGSRNHEAAAIDPINHVCYMTEDAGAGRFWRFVSDASDLSGDNGVTRMGLENGSLQVMNVEGFENGGEPTEQDVELTRKVTWVVPETIGGVAGVGGTPTGTAFNGGEGIWYYEVPPQFRTIPELGTEPTRGVVFFTTKGDNRVWAYDIENELIELIFDNGQIAEDMNDVDNLTVSPAGDVVVAEDGSQMRLMVVIPNRPAKILMQIIGNPSSEIVGPAFHPDGSKLYFSAQRAPTDEHSGGVTYELTIPPDFR